MPNQMPENLKNIKDILDLDEELHKVSPEAETVGEKSGVRAKKGDINFQLKPEELESYLNKYKYL